MFYSLTGPLVHREPGMLVVDCGGVGYKCSTTMTTLQSLPDLGSRVTVYTYLHVREDAMDLYGFSTLSELNCFKLLISISGVGPKAATAILSDMNPERFTLCVVTGDAKALTKAQGIGLKTAQRIVLELKDKFKGLDVPQGAEAVSGPALPAGDNLSEAVSALMVLGYSRSEAASAVSGADPKLSVEELIRHGLKWLVKK